MSEPTELDLAAYALIEAKQQEEAARNARLAAEERLIELIGVKEEGTTSKTTDFYKISTVGNLTRSLDEVRFDEVREAIGDVLFETFVTYIPKLSVSGFKRLASANPDAFKVAARCVASRPAKPTVKVEEIKPKASAMTKNQQKEAA